MNYVYCVMVSDKFERKGLLSSEAYNTIEKAQKFCEGRSGAKKVNEMYWSSTHYEYRIMQLPVK